MPCPDPEVVQALADGTLVAERRAPLLAHAEECEPCRRLVAAVVRGDGGDRRIPRRIGRFHPRAVLGSGAMGLVLEAHDPELDRRVALKLLHDEDEAGDAGDVRRVRLRREAQALARLSHPNIVAVHEVGTDGARVFLVMELVDGGTLRAWLRAKPRGWREILEAFRAAGRGLAAAHAVGLVHRDFKPENVLVGDDGRVRVGDFGLVASGAFGPARGGSLSITATGAQLGTPFYMAPEQLLGKPVDARADVFAFAVTLYEALYGERPFSGRDLESLIADVTGDRPVTPPGGRDVPSWLREVVLRGLARDPAARWPSMDALLAALDRDPARARRRILTGAAVVAMAGLAAWGFSSAAIRSAAEPPCSGSRAELAGAWDEGVSAAVRAGFVATGAPFAEDAWRRVSVELETYADGWAKVHRRACEATQRGEQSAQALDRQMSCLARRRQSLRTLATVLARTDTTGVSRAASAVAALDDPAACADLSTPEEVPADPTTRRRIEVVRAQLAAASTLGELGDTRAAAALAELGRTLAASVDDLALRAEALAVTGAMRRRNGQLAPARDILLDAVVAAEEADADDVAVDARVHLGFLLGSEEHRHEEALRTMALAAAKLRRHPDAAREARLEAALGAIYFDQQDMTTSRSHYERALTLEMGLPSPRSGRIARLLVNLGNVAYVAEDYPRALELYERAATMYEAAFGPEHPDVATALHNMASPYVQLAQYDKALATYQHALALRERALGPEHRDVAITLLGMSRVYDHQDALEAGEAVTRRAIAILERRTPDDPQLGQAYDFLGAILHRRGQSEAALDAYRHALATKARVLGVENPDLGYSWRDIGDTLLALGRLPEAEDAHRKAQQLFAGQGAGTVDANFSGYQLADTISRRGRHGEALHLFAESCAALEKALGPKSWRFGFCLGVWGEGLARAGRTREAIAMLERSLAIAEADEDPEQMASLRQILAGLR